MSLQADLDNRLGLGMAILPILSPMHTHGVCSSLPGRLPCGTWHRRSLVSSSSSASAGSGENRLDRRGEEEPVLVMLEVSSDELLALLLRSDIKVVPVENFFPREGGARSVGGAGSRQKDGDGHGLGSRSSRMSSRDS